MWKKGCLLRRQEALSNRIPDKNCVPQKRVFSYTEKTARILDFPENSFDCSGLADFVPLQ
jgi:hypothetical protein